MGLDFAELEKSFYSIFEHDSIVFIELVRAYYGEMDVDKLWENCKQIEKKWETLVIKQKNELKWLIFGDYPASVNTYLYTNRIYGKKLIENHVNRGIILFDLIPLTVSYKKIKSNIETDAYIRIFDEFRKFRNEKWKLLKHLVGESTKFALTYARQDKYKQQLKEDCEQELDFKVHIESWNRDYSESCDIYDRIEKIILIFD